MATIMLVYRCLVCGYIMETRLRQEFTCPCCGKNTKMHFITTTVKKD